MYNDGLTKDGSCANNGENPWTYNQGVVLVGLGYLYKSTLSDCPIGLRRLTMIPDDNQDQAYIDAAYKLVDAVIDNLTIDGGLRENCETTSQNLCNADQTSFKGIFHASSCSASSYHFNTSCSSTTTYPFGELQQPS